MTKSDVIIWYLTGFLALATVMLVAYFGVWLTMQAPLMWVVWALSCHGFARYNMRRNMPTAETEGDK